MKIVGMISAFNEDDIIEEMIKHHLSQGLVLVVLDGGSTDSTYEICKKFSGKGQLRLYRHSSSQWDLGLNLRISYDLALLEKPDWIIHMDTDEFFESGMDGLRLDEAIKKVDEEGFNIIQFDRFEFFMTDDDNNSAKTILEKFPYYSFETDYLYRAWKFTPGIQVDPTGGHLPIFPEGTNYRIYPSKFVCRHYRFRNTAQAEKKLQSRIQRTTDTSDAKLGWHSHDQKIIKQNKHLVVDHKLLAKYNNDNHWDRKEKFSYFERNHPKKDELFTKEGFLKQKYLTYNELRLEIAKQQKQIKTLQEQVKISNGEEKPEVKPENTIKTLEKTIHEQDNKIKSLENTIRAIQNSFTWRTLTPLDKFRKRIFSSKK